MEKPSRCGWLHTPLRATVPYREMHVRHSGCGTPGAQIPLGTITRKKQKKKNKEQALYSCISSETKSSFSKAPIQLGTRETLASAKTR